MHAISTVVVQRFCDSCHDFSERRHTFRRPDSHPYLRLHLRSPLPGLDQFIGPIFTVISIFSVFHHCSQDSTLSDRPLFFQRRRYPPSSTQLCPPQSTNAREPRRHAPKAPKNSPGILLAMQTAPRQMRPQPATMSSLYSLRSQVQFWQDPRALEFTSHQIRPNLLPDTRASSKIKPS